MISILKVLPIPSILSKWQFRRLCVILLLRKVWSKWFVVICSLNHVRAKKCLFCSNQDTFHGKYCILLSLYFLTYTLYQQSIYLTCATLYLSDKSLTNKMYERILYVYMSYTGFSFSNVPRYKLDEILSLSVASHKTICCNSLRVFIAIIFKKLSQFDKWTRTWMLNDLSLWLKDFRSFLAYLSTCECSSLSSSITMWTLMLMLKSIEIFSFMDSFRIMILTSWMEVIRCG